MSKFFQSSSLAGYGVILTVLDQIIDINEFGTVGKALTETATQGGSPSMILIAAAAAALGAIFKDERKGK